MTDLRAPLSAAVQRQVRIHGGLTVEAIGDAIADVLAPIVEQIDAMRAAQDAHSGRSDPAEGDGTPESSTAKSGPIADLADWEREILERQAQTEAEPTTVSTATWTYPDGTTVPVPVVHRSPTAGASVVRIIVENRTATFTPTGPPFYSVEERAAMEARIADQFKAALLDGLDQLDRDEYRRVSPGDVADLVHRVAAEVGRG